MTTPEYPPPFPPQPAAYPPPPAPYAAHPSPNAQFDPPYAPMSAYQTPTPRQLPLSKAAIASFVLSIPGALLLSIIFGIVGMRATANGTRRGRGFAVAGLVISLVWIVGIVGLVAYNKSQEADRGLDGSVQNAGKSDVLSLQKGDCLQDPTATTTGAITKVDVLPCTQSHDAQVFDVDVVSSGDGTYDQARIKTEVETLCTAAAKTAITTNDTFDLLYFYPEDAGWQRGDRTAVCMLASSTPLTKSVVGS